MADIDHEKTTDRFWHRWAFDSGGQLVTGAIITVVLLGVGYVLRADRTGTFFLGLGVAGVVATVWVFVSAFLHFRKLKHEGLIAREVGFITAIRDNEFIDLDLTTPTEGEIVVQLRDQVKVLQSQLERTPVFQKGYEKIPSNLQISTSRIAFVEYSEHKVLKESSEPTDMQGVIVSIVNPPSKDNKFGAAFDVMLPLPILS